MQVPCVIDIFSEEIAFYQGQQRERHTVLHSFDKLISHLRSFILFRFSVGFLDNVIAKYIATVVGWWTVSRPFFDKSNDEMNNKTKNELMQVCELFQDVYINVMILQDYYNSGRMMFRLAQALGRLALAGREMTRLAGFTARVNMLMNVLGDLQKGHYERTMVSTTNTAANHINGHQLNGDDDDTDALMIGVERPLFAAGNGIDPHLTYPDYIQLFRRADYSR